MCLQDFFLSDLSSYLTQSCGVVVTNDMLMFHLLRPDLGGPCWY